MWVHPKALQGEKTNKSWDALSRPVSKIGVVRQCLHTLLHPRSQDEYDKAKQTLARIEKEGPGISKERSR